VRPAEHFVKFFRQLPGLSQKELTLEDWEEFLSVEDRDEFRARVEVTFPGLTEKEKDRMAQFLYDKNQELLREAAEEQSAPEDPEHPA
jgi:hypothetical protein